MRRRMASCVFGGTAQVVFLKFVNLEWNLNFFFTTHPQTNRPSPAALDICRLLFRVILCLWVCFRLTPTKSGHKVISILPAAGEKSTS